MIYIVVDTKGAGRIVGTFESEDRAKRILAIDPSYFRIVAIEPNTINPAAIDWLPTKEKREALRSA